MRKEDFTEEALRVYHDVLEYDSEIVGSDIIAEAMLRAYKLGEVKDV